VLVVIVDYGLGNLRSVEGAVERLGHTPLVSSAAADLERADRLILPGVGAFADGMRNLEARGLVEPLTRQVVGARTPVLGICLGAQLMATEGHEFGVNRGLGWIDAVVERIAPADPSLRIPHVGWNALRQVGEDPLLAGIPEDALFYFVHSFHIRCADVSIVKADCDYGRPMAAVIHQDNVFGTQFHPEKSQRYGLQLLGNFLAG
jgi:imidazole glycerol-phosphate synthase subunit HisH